MKDVDIQWAKKMLKNSDEKIKAELSRLGNAIPYMPQDGKYADVVSERGLDWWTNGFWGGILWQLYNNTKDEVFKQAAIEQEKRLDEALYKFKDIHHDVGFMWLHTSVTNFKMTGDEQAYRTGLHAATLLAGRFNVAGEFLVAWNNEPGWVIIDSMMNIQLLFWASMHTKDPRFEIMAKKHADTIAKNLVREDGSVGHIGSFNANTGEFLQLLGGQGYSAESAWSRGNSWAVYGFALCYKYTGNSYYLNIAKRVANYFINAVSKTGYIPNVDFKAPLEPEIYDTSAGLCAACGLLEIAKSVTKDEKEFYETAAVNILKATQDKYANWDLETDGIIGGATEAYHRPSTYEVPLIYSDYFFIEGLSRIVGEAIDLD